jgi:hypothetical protein
MLQGAFVYVSGLIGKTDAGSVNIETPVGGVGIRGTEFVIRYDPGTGIAQVDLGIGSIAIIPLLSGVTTEYDALHTIVFDSSTILSASPLTQESYDLVKHAILARLDGINEAPTCAADEDTTAEDVALNGTIDTCADVDLDTLTYAEGSTPATNGSVVVNLDGSFTFTPAADFNGDATFSFRANDGTVDSTDATFTVHVTAVVDEATFDALLDAVEELDLADGIEQSLVRKIANAQEDFAEGDLAGARDKLESLLSQIDALAGKKLTTEQAAILRSLTEVLLEALSAA